MHVRGESARVVERADADETKPREPTVLAPQRSPTSCTPIDTVRSAAVRRHCGAYELAAGDRDTIRFDQRIEHERSARLALAVVTVTAVHEHGSSIEPIAHGPACAPAG